MSEFILSDEVDEDKIFLVKLSNIKGRIDPLYYSKNMLGFFKKIKYKSYYFNQLILNIKSGIGAGKQDQSDSINGILHLRPTNINKDSLLKFDKNIYIPNNISIPKVKKNDILFNNTNSQELVGKTVFINDDLSASFSNHITRIRVNNDMVEAKFLWIILNFYQNKKIFYNLCTNWNNQSGVGLEVLKKLIIPLPPKNIQKNIINIMDNAYSLKQQKEKQAKELLDSIDTYLLNELGITLPQIDNSLEKRMFEVKLSEVSGGRFDSHFYTKEYKKTIEAINNSRYSVIRIKDKCTFIAGYAFKSSDYIKISNTMILTIKNIFKNSIKLEKVTYIPNSFFQEYKKYAIHKNDLLIAMTGATIGKVGLFDITQNALLNQRNGIIRSSKINTKFLMNLLNIKLYQKIILMNAVGGAQPNISETGIINLKIPLPPIEKQNEIAKHIQDLRDEAKKLKNEASQDLENAKLEVEKMILGQV